MKHSQSTPNDYEKQGLGDRCHHPNGNNNSVQEYILSFRANLSTFTYLYFHHVHLLRAIFVCWIVILRKFRIAMTFYKLQWIPLTLVWCIGGIWHAAHDVVIHGTDNWKLKASMIQLTLFNISIFCSSGWLYCWQSNHFISMESRMSNWPRTMRLAPWVFLQWRYFIPSTRFSTQLKLLRLMNTFKEWRDTSSILVLLSMEPVNLFV